jgi:hypothetical protein
MSARKFNGQAVGTGQFLLLFSSFGVSSLFSTQCFVVFILSWVFLQLSEAEVLRDLIPGYRIRMTDDEEDSNRVCFSFACSIFFSFTPFLLIVFLSPLPECYR